jgi:hypothetical protein
LSHEDLGFDVWVGTALYSLTTPTGQAVTPEYNHGSEAMEANSVGTIEMPLGLQRRALLKIILGLPFRVRKKADTTWT